MKLRYMPLVLLLCSAAHANQLTDSIAKDMDSLKANDEALATASSLGAEASQHYVHLQNDVYPQLQSVRAHFEADVSAYNSDYAVLKSAIDAHNANLCRQQSCAAAYNAEKGQLDASKAQIAAREQQLDKRRSDLMASYANLSTDADQTIQKIKQALAEYDQAVADRKAIIDDLNKLRAQSASCIKLLNAQGEGPAAALKATCGEVRFDGSSKNLPPPPPGAPVVDKALEDAGNALASPQADAVTYNLTSTENANIGGSNPSGPWSFLGGSVAMTFFTIPQPSGSCFSSYPGLTRDWTPPGSCIPAFAVASGTGPGSPADFVAGDILVHSQDPVSGSASGQASITWTAPASGSITISGSIWYAQSAQQRSNQFTLTLGGNTLASGTVAYNSPAGSDRANPLHFSGGGTLLVTAGEVLALEIQRSPGQPYGSIDGIDLTVIETAAH